MAVKIVIHDTESDDYYIFVNNYDTIKDFPFVRDSITDDSITAIVAIMRNLSVTHYSTVNGKFVINVYESGIARFLQGFANGLMYVFNMFV